MGPRESKPKEEDINLNKEDQEQIINHPIFKQRKIISAGNTQEQFNQITVGVPSEKEYNAWKNQLQKLGVHECLLLPQFHQFKKQGFCGSSGSVIIKYENYPFLLSDEIRNRECLNTKYFEENELWYLIYTLVSAGQIFHSSGNKIGDVQPGNIFISQDGSVKVANQYSWPNQQINYQKTFFEKEVTYLAPEEIKDINFGKSESTSNQELAETFSIGLTCLDAATLSNSTDLYAATRKFQYQKLDTRLKELNNSDYSQALKLLITNMCESDADNRTNCRQLFKWLDPYSEAINNFEQFTPTNFPEKIKRQQAIYQGIPQQGYQKYITPTFNLPNNLYQNNYVQNTYQSTFIPPIAIRDTNLRFNENLESYKYTLPEKRENTDNQKVYAYGPNINSQISDYAPVNSITTTFGPTSAQYNLQNQYVAAPLNQLSTKSKLQQIDEQLSMSRKLFPS